MSCSWFRPAISWGLVQVAGSPFVWSAPTWRETARMSGLAP